MFRGRHFLGTPMSQVSYDAMQGSVQSTLRAATRGAHASIDRMLLPLNLSQAEDYRLFLEIHSAALVRLQADWRPRDAPDFAQMLQSLQADLQTLGCPTTAPPRLSHTMTATFVGLGIGYVLRGSRLGAAVLRRGVARGLPTAYLDFVPTVSWASFLLELESIANDPSGRAQVTRAAQSTFNTFSVEFTRIQGAGSTTPQ